MTLPLFGQLELPLHHGPAPAGQRRIQIGASIVAYDLVRGRRRGLRLGIDHRGLRVGAPMRASLAEIEQFIRAHGAWVLSKLRAWRDAQDGQRVAVCHGAVIPVLGMACELRVRRGANRVRWGSAELWLETDRATPPRDILVAALKTRALEVFAERADSLAPQLPVERPRIALSDAQTRWGSCSAKGGVRLNWRLVHVPLRLIDYVVAHELAHVREMNHSPRFWSLVERALPDYRAARAELRACARELPHF